MGETWPIRWLRGRWRADLVRRREQVPVDAWNAYSNAAYAVAGIVTLLIERSLAAAVFAFCLVVLAWGSYRYHAFKTRSSNSHDRYGMFSVFGSLAVHGIAPGHPDIAIPMGVGAVVLSAALTYVMPKTNLNTAMGVLLGFASVPAWLDGSPLLAVLSFAVFGVAFVIWNLDVVKDHELPDPEPHPIVGLWGHGAWHVLTAIAIPLMYFAQGPR